MKGPLDSSGHARSESIVPLLPYAENSRPSTPLSSKFSHRQSAPDVQRRRVFFLAGAILSVVSVMALATLTIGRTTGGAGYVVSELEEGHSQASNVTITPSVSVAAPSPPASTSAVPEVSHEKVDTVIEVTPSHSPYLLGPPADRFRDNLRNDTKYITSWISAGWSKSLFSLQLQIF